MGKVLIAVFLFVIGVLCWKFLLNFIEGDEVVFTEFLCPDDLTDNYANIHIDDDRLMISYNSSGHWRPHLRDWQSTLIHNEDIVVWQVDPCRGLVTGLEDLGSRTERCFNETTPELSELWVLERASERLSMWVWTNEGSLRRYNQFCGATDWDLLAAGYAASPPGCRPGSLGRGPGCPGSPRN